MTEQITDQQIIDRVLSGNKNAFNLLVTKYQNRLANAVSSFVLPGEIADLVQESFIKAYRSLASFKGESSFYTWLYRIAINTGKNHVTMMARRPPLKDVDVFESENVEGYYPLSDIETPENLLLSEEIKTTIFSAINSLPAELKQVLLLREIEGVSYEEIAKMVDVPIGTVRSRLFRARDLIAKRMERLEND